ncbi:MAG TPA: glycosyltransferase family 1 protein [Thermosulfidibacter takaii]|uniref:Glycosyltransferase family 1 protein n=1 Tax=Thermosulfidibacter takaii TaxID=412593 RepID=A0A7C0YE37_9BACT|nr:glycosyltransferase family 1 protein [Thermosulfidibacter takaii]
MKNPRRSPDPSSSLRVAYFTSMDLPSSKAHALQIMETCTALTHLGVEVHLVVSSLQGNPTELWKWYGVEPVPKALHIIPLAQKRKALPFLLSQKAKLAYTRSTRWARFLLSSRWLHGTPVVFETHRKSLYHRRDLETGQGKARNREVSRLEEIFQMADGVVCAHGTTWSSLKGRGVKSLLLWYGWTHQGLISRGPWWKVGYASFKEKESILEAVKLVPGLELHIFGSSEEEEMKLGDSKVVFHPLMPHRELMKKLASAGIMVSLDEGLKLADYLSLGGAIVAPELPSTQEILGKSALYFSFGSAPSLAEALKRIKESPHLFETLKKASVTRSEKYRWPHKALKLKEFLQDLVNQKATRVPLFPRASRGRL